MKLLSLLTAMLAAVAGCQKYTDLNAEAFEALLRGGEVFLLDVRTAEEYEAARLEGAANADWKADDFLETAARICPKDRPVAVYCRSGRRSAAAAQSLCQAGYQVYNLLGGIEGWTAAGKATVSSKTSGRHE